uniref:Uncharacterized protein n=1 Tax=Arundo donax TaxID=35708 RepID=A0A0A9BTF0_ARUDO
MIMSRLKSSVQGLPQPPPSTDTTKVTTFVKLTMLAFVVSVRDELD